MSFDRRVQHGLYTAEQVEIAKSEEHFVGDLRNLLDDTAMREGVHINLGDDPASIERILDLLDLESHIGPSNYFNVMAGAVRNGMSKSVMSHATVSPVVERHGVRIAAELMQVNAWHLGNQTFKRIETIDERATSWLTLLHGSNINEDNFALEANSTAVIVGVSARYRPECIDDQGEGLGAGYLLEEASKVKNYRDRIARFGELLEYNYGTLELPERNYFVRIGQCMQGDGTPANFGFSPVDIYPRHGTYDLKNGRIVQST